jgi:hypothetical protein
MNIGMSREFNFEQRKIFSPHGYSFIHAFLVLISPVFVFVCLLFEMNNRTALLLYLQLNCTD